MQAPQPAPGLPSPSGCTCFKLRSLSRRVTQLYDQTMAPAGITVTQFSLIAQARRARARPPTLSDLADNLHTDRTTLTRNLRPLLVAGLLQLRPGADARSKAVAVTAAGEAAFQAARPLWHEAQQRVRGLLGADGVARLHALVDSLLPQIEASADAPRA
ncbi:MAG: winged helix-turn-helix transcriptional regulator [Burkholderiales bacterium]|nr:winged helix-turn-helix transcriptional regulator [Burkholderiales bacterium]